MNTAYVDGSVLCAGPVGAHRVAYREWGGWRDRTASDSSPPPVLVCVHGLTRNGLDFDTLGAALGGEFRVICPDLPGRGSSDWLSDPSYYRLETYVADMLELLRQLGVQHVHWLGTSLGGLVGMLLASLPDSPVVRLVLNDIGPRIERVALQRIAGYVGQTRVFSDIHEAERYVRLVSAPFGALSDADWQHLTQVVLRPRREGGFEFNYDPAIAEAFRRVTAASDFDLWPFYRRIRCPTLVMRGELSDLLSRESAAEMAACGPHARVVEIAGVGHAPMFLDPAQIALVRGFFQAR